MAYIKIGSVKVTPNLAVDYAKSDKVNLKVKSDISLEDKCSVEIGNSNDVSAVTDYAMRDKSEGEIVFKTLNSSFNCTLENASSEWETIRVLHEKNDKNLAFHIKQSFKGVIDPEVAHEVGRKFAERFLSDFQCVVSTHTNTDNTHNHIVFNSVSFKTGKKYYDNHASYRNMRKVSNDICREHGLPVMDNTEEYKLVKYKDSNGKVKFYEPTERKSQIQIGKYSNANDYRNTDAFSHSEERTLSNRDVIKNDIDKLLDVVYSYDELLERLQDIGYEIRSKKVNGDWLKNISFKAPMQERFSRDSSLGENYTRDYLQKYFDEKSLSDKSESIDANVVLTTDSQIEKDVIYEYGSINILELDEDYRKKNGTIYKRSSVERLIVSDTKILNKELESKYWDSIKMARENREQLLKNKRSQYLLDCINANLRTLQFVENKNIQSFSQISAVVGLLYEKRNQAQSQLMRIKGLLKNANESVVLIEKYNRLKSQIDLMKSQSNFSVSDMSDDISLLNTYETLLKQRNLVDSESQNEFIEKIQKYTVAFDELSLALKSINGQIKEYDDCVYTINRIDKDGVKKYEKEISQYYESKNDNIDKSKKSNSRDER